MIISIIENNHETILNKNVSIPFYRGCLLCFKNKKNIKHINLFESDVIEDGITIIPTQFPNKKFYSLEKIRTIMKLFPIIKEKHYNNSGLIAFNVVIDNRNELPIVILLEIDSEIYVVCLALIGGEYSRNPGTSIMLLDIKKLDKVSG